jgi:hypothetical protein
MTGWHLTWQDPAALLLIAACLWLSLWLRARLPGAGGCAKAPPQRLIPPQRLLRSRERRDATCHAQRRSES